jgi:hypothetical protein
MAPAREVGSGRSRRSFGAPAAAIGGDRRVSAPDISRANGGSDWIGDYIGVTSAGGTLYVAFTDNSTGKGHIHFVRVPDAS